MINVLIWIYHRFREPSSLVGMGLIAEVVSHLPGVIMQACPPANIMAAVFGGLAIVMKERGSKTVVALPIVQPEVLTP